MSNEKTFLVYDPATDKVIANVADFGIDNLRDAVTHEKPAFKRFRRSMEHERSLLLN